ncbi:MAG TPA: holdfast anchoring protein HfaA [Rhizomicrobium sp.]|jgi:holdfast attachment protein HfaA|nr:holdfast anchoring protein HfaA [Rhizomicrobium sp.]
MTNIKTLLLTGTAFAALTTAAVAGPYDQSANYNSGMGMTGTSMNAPVNSSLRDANGNLEVVDGKITSSSFSEVGGVQGFNPGTSGVGGTSSATAIGNQLNVVTMGSNNIVIVDSTQINNGDQNANNNVN